jgi:hypothetical protein
VRACEQLLARVSEGEKLGMPAEVVQVMRLTGEAMLVGALGGQAEDLLNGTPPDLTAARPLLARALELADSVNTRPIPKDADPAVAATMKALQARLAQATPELKALDARANPKR